jgi:23S rRNA (guanosine2251-2'-O)-methyltransferase
MTVYGVNPVMEALKARRVTRIFVGRRDDQRLQRLLALAAERRVPVERVDPEVLDRRSRDGVHQGVVAELSAAQEYGVVDLVEGAGGPALLVVLDGIEDPHNVGAIVRSVDAAGAHGVVRQTRRAAALDAVAAKASAGAVAHVPVADVVNIARAIDELKSLNVWVVGLAGDAPQSYETIDWTAPSAIVLGAEGSGLRRLVRESCDFLVSIPMAGHVESLNVSVAAGVVLFEAARQRRARGRLTPNPGD